MNLPYSFFPSEPAVFMEIYLPKKANFQGTLYQALTAGFDREVVKAHFRDPVKARTIKQLLSRYYSLANYEQSMIDKFQPVFFGYSMYEVDGVFSSDNKGVVEERVQAIRMIFRPHYEQLFQQFRLVNDEKANSKQIRVLVRSFLRFASPDMDDFLMTLPRDESYSVKKELISEIDRWIEYVCLFVFGFLIYEICAKIVELYHQDYVDLNKIEEEIWVTSFWNLGVNGSVFNQGATDAAIENLHWYCKYPENAGRRYGRSAKSCV